MCSMLQLKEADPETSQGCKEEEVKATLRILMYTFIKSFTVHVASLSSDEENQVSDMITPMEGTLA